MKLKLFTADWCGSCQSQKEILNDFDAVPVEMVDIDEDPDAAAPYGVQSIPTLILEDDGDVVERWTGVTQRDEIEAEL